MKFSTPVLLLAALLGLTRCNPQLAPVPEDKMPAATQTGANTAGCVVDGLTWVPRHNGQMMNGTPLPAIDALWRKVRGGRHPLELTLTKNIDDRTHVHGETSLKLYVPDITGPGTFTFDQSANPSVVNGPTAYARFTFKRSPAQELLTGPGAPGRLVVTRLDTVARVVSGTFEFTPAEVTSGLTGNGTPIPGGKTARVTEGRFDCKF
ncbi:hypothetical protein BEN47_08220 [Hymenobacter lapidarius]|uniref:Lipoprotein n=1 Tax=Hymenobacter lapidarius TaxID=1908237 RepID=A0A1G1TE25_9BACT|nr:hypothetical protein [Hymenobacter lapidarius]OGX89100.1 hypothetical protein BEN47_08220 [Hymenobacter lapidarius]